MVFGILSVASIVLGFKAFTPAGLPLTREIRLTGKNARNVGGACIGVGVAIGVVVIVTIASQY